MVDNAIIINGEVYVLDDNFDEGNDCENCALREMCCGGFDLICTTLFDAGQGSHFIKAEMPEPVFWHKGENPPSDDRLVVGYWKGKPEEGWVESLYYADGQWHCGSEFNWATSVKNTPDFWIDRPQYDKDDNEE